jgi:methionine-rich copper-binding protein CopC
LHQEPTQPQRQPSEPIRRTVVTAPETGRTETAPEQVSQPRTVRPSAQPNAQFVRDVNIPDDTRLTAGSSFTKTWRIRNNGNAAWQAGYRIVHVGGTAMTDRTSQPVPAIQPGQEADVSVTLVAPSTPGTYVSDWRFQDDRSNFFGTNVFTRIISEAAAPSPATGFSNSQYVADITIPDDTVMEPGQSFTKTWRLRNNGSRNWGAGFTAAFLSGTALTPTTSHPAPSAAANSDVNLSIPMTAPNEAGTYTSEWVLKDDQGNVFGTNFYTRIVVKKKLGIRPQVTLQTGMNINPDAPHSNPVDSDALRGMDWVRFVFKLAARENPAERDDINHAFAQYDPLIRKYNNKGVKSLIVLNQETVWGNAPWTGNNDWRTYGNQLARVARQIAERYREYGEQVAYEIWNEGDLPQNPASVFVEPEQFAVVLKIVAETIRVASPQSPLVFGGLATGPNQGIAYLHRCLKALGGIWPVDAIGIHPYGRWATRAPFDWGQQFGTLAQAFAEYENNFPDIPFWITEIGVAADNEIGSQHYAAVADYLTDVYQHIGEQHTHIAPVVIWFAWSDWMRNAGIVTQDGSHKAHVYDAFQAVIKSKDK